MDDECGETCAGLSSIGEVLIGKGILQEFVESHSVLVLFSLLKQTLVPIFGTEDIAEALQKQVFVAYVIREVFIVGEEMFDASLGGFASGWVGLVESGERDTVPIRNISLLNIMVEQDLELQLCDEFIQSNVQETSLSSKFTGFTGKDGHNSAHLVFLLYVGCGELIQDQVDTIDKRFIFLSCGTFFGLEDVF